jgi:ATP-dependent Zn protease
MGGSRRNSLRAHRPLVSKLTFLAPEDRRFTDLLISLIPALILLGPILYLLGGGFGRNGLLGIGRSPAQLIDPKRNGLSFADVGRR